MRFDELRKQEYIKGLAEGEKIGLERLGKLYRRLRSEDRLDDYDRAVEEEAFRTQLFEEFGL